MNNKKIDMMKKARLHDLFEQSGDISNYFIHYCAYLNELLLNIDNGQFSNIVNCLLRARDRDATVFFAGNGGSAATASHFAQDLAEVGRKAKSKHFRTISLTDSVPSLTALANDYGYEAVFIEQLSNLFNKGDVLVAISASGNSINIIKAVEFAKKMGGETIGLTGFDGGKLKDICHYSIYPKTDKGEYGPVEDIHLIVDHVITSFLIFSDIAQSGVNSLRSKICK